MHRILQDHLMLCLQASEEKGKNGAIRKVTGYYSYYSCQTNVAGYKVQCLVDSSSNIKMKYEKKMLKYGTSTFKSNTLRNVPALFVCIN